MNKTYRLIWNHVAQTWQAVAESARGRGKTLTASLVIAASAAFTGTAGAVPAVFFDGTTSAGQTTFSNVVTTADPTAVIFQYDFSTSSSNQFSVTQGGTTVYVRTLRNGVANSYTSGFDNWSVNYNTAGGTAAWNEIVLEGFTVEFYSDAAYTTPHLVNAVGITVNDWGTCCTAGGVTPDGSVVAGSAIYAVFDASTAPSTTLIGNITSSADRGTLDNLHFVAAIDDRNSFSSVTFAPNGSGEYFGAGGTLYFSYVPLNSVPEGSSSVTIGQPPVPTIDTTRNNYTTSELSASEVRPIFEGGTLTLANSGTVTADFEIRAAGGTIDTGGNAGVFTGDIVDGAGAAGSLAKAGAGTLTLAGANTYTGSTTVAGGTLELTGSLTSTDIQIDAGATLTSTNGGLASASQVRANGTLAIGANETITTLLGTGGANLGTHTLQVSDGDFSGVVSGSGQLQKTGSGLLVLSGTNTHTGSTRVSGGTVAISSDANLGGTGASVVLDGGTLEARQSMVTGKAVDVTAQGGTLHTDAATTTVLTGAMSGSGAFVKQGAGELIVAGTSSHTGAIALQQGTLKVHADLVSGNGLTVFNGTTLGGYGRIGGTVQVLSGGRLSPGASPGTLTVAGDVTLNAGSIFDVEIDGYGTGTGAGNYDRLVITGNHTFTAAGTLNAIMRGITGSANNDFTAQVGDVFHIVEAADGAVTGRFDTLVQPVGGGLPDRARYSLIYEPQRINLVVLPFLFTEAADLGGGRRNAMNAGEAMDGLYDRTDLNGTTAAASLLRSFSATTEAGLAVHFASLSGEAHATALAEATRDSHGLRDAVFNRSPVEYCGTAKEPATQAAVDPENRDCHRVWASVSRAEHEAGANAWANTTDSTTTLAAVGVERRLRDNMVAGLAFGLAQGKVTSTFTSDLVKTDSLQASGYLSLPTKVGQFTQMAGVGVGRHDVQRQASVAGMGMNDASYSSVRLFGDSRLVTPVASWGNTSLSSVVGLRLDYLHRGGKTESGDAASALELASYNKLHAQALVGGVLRHAFAETEQRRSEFTLDATYGHDLSGRGGVGTTVGIHGSNWNVRSAGDGAGELTLGVGVNDQRKNSTLGVRAFAGMAKGGISNRGLQFNFNHRW
jgi:autotransporter-associated beta strand protein